MRQHRSPETEVVTTDMQSNRSSSAHGRRPKAEFQMPLPRFHPAVYQSPTGSNTSSAITSPRTWRVPPGLKTPSSPRQQATRQYNEATRKLMEYQQEIFRTTGGAGNASLLGQTPHAPSLGPCRSPGPATPLNLEEQSSDYLTAGAARRGAHGETLSQRELVEAMIREEQERQRGGTQSGPSSPPASPAPAT